MDARDETKLSILIKELKMEQSNKFGKIKKSVQTVFRAMPIGKEFKGWELKNACVDIYPELENSYVDTFLREMRRSFHMQYILISRSESLYKKVAGSSFKEEARTSLRENEFERYKKLKQQDFDFGEV